MHIAYTPEQEQLRRELRAYFAGIMTPELRAEAASEGEAMDRDSAYCKVIRQMGQDGWLGIGWPKEYGGQALSNIEQLVFHDEAMGAGASIPLLTLNSVGPAIMEFGSDEQKAFFLPRILAGELHFAIGYSEPGAGTDLAALRTSAVREGDEWVINGEKMWTSLASVADYIWLAVRTDPEQPRHKGLSVFCVPTDTPGFSWTPVPTLTGQTTTATLYDNVRVPHSALVGEPGDGWKLITGQLNHERVALCSAYGLQLLVNQTHRWARQVLLPDGTRLIDREVVRLNLGRLHARTEYLKLLNWKAAWGADHGAKFGPAQASTTKVFGTELYVEAYRMLMDILGEEAYLTGAAAEDDLGGQIRSRVERMYRICLMLTFGGGTNEIQRDMIAMLGLGMPRPPR